MGYYEEFENIIENENLKLKEVLSKLLKTNGFCDRFAKDNKNKIKMTQLRKLFSELKKITKKEKFLKISSQNNFELEMDIYKLFPIIAYNEEKGLIPTEFSKILKLILEKITECENEEKKLFYLKILDSFLVGLMGYLKKYNPKA